MSKGKVFISYSRLDKAYVDKLSEVLRKKGLTVWFDINLVSGQDWDDALEEQIKGSDHMIIVLSKTSVASDNVKNEMRFAMDHGKQIHPILIEECSVPLSMRRMHYIDFLNLDYDQAINKLVDDINSYSADPNAKPIVAKQEVENNSIPQPNKLGNIKTPILALLILAIGSLLAWQFWPLESKDIDVIVPEAPYQKAYKIIGDYRANPDDFGKGEFPKQEPYDYNYLTSMAFFAIPLDGKTGRLFKDDSDIPVDSIDVSKLAKFFGCTDMVNIAKQHRHESLISFVVDDTDNELFLINPEACQYAIDLMLKFLVTEKVNGLKLYFNEIPKAYKDELVDFMIRLKKEMTASNAEYELYLGLPFEDKNSVYDIEALNYSVDYFILGPKTYDSKSTPLGSFSNWKNAINSYLTHGVPPSKCIITIPYQGTQWAKEPIEGSLKTKYSIASDEVLFINIKRFHSKDAIYDKDRNSMIRSYKGKYNLVERDLEVWYDNDKALAVKYDFIKDHNLAGINIFFRC